MPKGGVSPFSKTAEVVTAWKEGRASYATNLRTDGDTLWSFDLPIGATRQSRKIVFDARSRAGRVFSRTTTRHVTLAIKVAHQVILLPDSLVQQWEDGKLQHPTPDRRATRLPKWD